jgi:hypothetical protein
VSARREDSALAGDARHRLVNIKDKQHTHYTRHVTSN